MPDNNKITKLIKELNRWQKNQRKNIEREVKNLTEILNSKESVINKTKSIEAYNKSIQDELKSIHEDKRFCDILKDVRGVKFDR